MNVKLPHKILVIDDDPALLELLKAFFGGDHRIFSAADMAEAREKLKKTRPDLVILDRVLPDGDGLQLCAEMRKNPRYRSLPVLVLTCKTGTCDKVFGLKLGGDDYLTKPFEPAELKARVAALLRRNKELNPGISVKRPLSK